MSGEGLKTKAIQRQTRCFKDTKANLDALTGLRDEDFGYATDTLVLYRWSGSAWEAVTIHASAGVAASIPTASTLPDGSIYYETDTQLSKQVVSSAWVIISQTTRISSGSYAGNNTVNRAIPHGLGLTPKILLILNNGNSPVFFRIYEAAYIYTKSSAVDDRYAVTIPDTTNFYVGNNTSYPYSANDSGEPYYWVAIG